MAFGEAKKGRVKFFDLAAKEVATVMSAPVDHDANYCVCGQPMDRHEDPMSAGHTPVSLAEHYGAPSAKREFIGDSDG